MTAYIFQKIAKEGRAAGITPNATTQARDWFRDQASQVAQVTPQKLMNTTKSAHLFRTINNADMGRMYHFFYDPKGKKELPYYDRFPLIFIVEKYKDGFLGINLHYLPLILRARLMDALYQNEMNDSQRKSTKLKITYSILKAASRYKYFKPCIKRYLNTHVRSRFLYIPYEHWDTAIMLPTERFVKQKKQHVWNESKNAINPVKSAIKESIAAIKAK